MPEKLTEEWQDKTIKGLVGGVNFDEQPEQLPDDQSPNLLNVFAYKKELRIDTGFADFRGVIRGKPRWAGQFFQTNGTSELLLITNATIYRDLSTQWQYLSDGTSTTTTAIEPAGETVIAVADRTGFSADDYIGLTLDDGSQHQSQIDSGYVSGTGAGNITINDAIPVGRQANNGAAFIKAVDLNGSDDIQISAVTVPWVDEFVFTNGVDPVKTYDGSSVTSLVTGLGFDLICRVLAVFRSTLFALFTTESGTAFPFRMRRSNGSTITDWTGGTAGFSDLLADESFIVAAQPLGPYLMVYKERSIIRVSYVGSADTLLSIETRIFAEGALSLDAVVDFGDFHFLAGNANFYEYRGGRSIDPVGDQVRDEIFGQQGELYNQRKGRSFIVYVEELDEAWFFYPTGTSDWPDKVVRYNVASQSWFPRTHTKKFSGFGFYQSEATVTWQNVQGTWQGALYPWNSQVIDSENPTTLLCEPDDLQVYEYDYIVDQDDGSDIPWVVETPDFVIPGHEIRIDQMWCKLAGVGVTVEISLDQGTTYKSYGSYSSTEYQEAVFKQQYVGDFVRFKFSGSGGGLRLGYVGFHYKAENRNR